MRVRLDYGKHGLFADLPDANLAGRVLTQTPAPVLADPDATVRAALANPIGTRPLNETGRGRCNACIVVCDITRPVPNRVLLPPILDALADAGIGRDRVTILVATGTHRPNDAAELDAMLGPHVARTCRVVNHVCTDPATHRSFGTTANGVPVFLDKTYCDADVKITVGLIEPHFMAGYSGGRKLVMPGIAALETVQAWHSPRFLEHPNATMGVVDNNPVHEESLRITQLVPPDLIVDVTLDAANKITGVFAGALEAAWRAGVAFAADHVRASVPAPVDIAVTTCAGWPLDATFYQAVKGMVGALPIVKRGGSIIIAAECSEGVGGEVFTRTLLETDDLFALVDAMQRPGWTYLPDQWEVEELAKAVRNNTVYCVCDPKAIPPDTLAGLFVTPAVSVEEAVAAALAVHGPAATLAAIPKGPYVIPYVATTER